MKLSDKKKSELYAAIAEPIMDERLMLQKYGSPGSEQLDERLFKMQNDIWRRVHKALNLDDPA